MKTTIETLKFPCEFNINAQIEKIREYCNDKIKNDHLDFHYHLLSNDVIKKTVLDIAKKIEYSC